MAGVSTPATDVSLSESYLECNQSFMEFLLALGEEDSRVIRLKQVHLPEILEEYGRTKVWGDQMKAELPTRARGSLDDTLRHDDELKNLVHAILLRLKALLDQATSIAKRKYDPAVGSDHDSVSSVSADSDSDSGNGVQEQPRRIPKIRVLVQQVLAQIGSLYDLSALLRRPNIADKYIRSVNSKSNTAMLRDPDTLPLSVSFGSLDERHIVEKALQWRGLTKSGHSLAFEDEEATPRGQRLAGDGVEDILWLCRRLARANTRRREQFQHWADHPYDPQQDMPYAAQLATPSLAQGPAKHAEERKDSQSQTSTLKPSDPNLPREGPKSVASKQSFSTVAVSDIYDTETNVRPRTVYAPTAIGQGRPNSVPDPPKTGDGHTTFRCPYCGTTLESSKMQNRQAWKRHVFRDLRPYVCTFEDCQNAGKLYVSRHNWIYHELQIHRRQFVCQKCHQRCPDRDSMVEHLQTHYGASVARDQLAIILGFCNRQIDVEDRDLCPFCGKELPLANLQEHIAGHMEDIALFVLPNAAGLEEDGASRVSGQAAVRGPSELEGSNRCSTLSSLDFSQSALSYDNPHSSAEFARLLDAVSLENSPKVIPWKSGEVDEMVAQKVQGRLENEYRAKDAGTPLVQDAEKRHETVIPDTIGKLTDRIPPALVLVPVNNAAERVTADPRNEHRIFTLPNGTCGIYMRFLDDQAKEITLGKGNTDIFLPEPIGSGANISTRHCSFVNHIRTGAVLLVDQSYKDNTEPYSSQGGLTIPFSMDKRSVLVAKGINDFVAFGTDRYYQFRIEWQSHGLYDFPDRILRVNSGRQKKYLKGAYIGGGPSGIVQLGLDITSGELIAVKTIRCPYQGALQSAKTEVDNLARVSKSAISHHHIIEFLGYTGGDLGDNFLELMMPLKEGNLKSLVEGRPSRDFSDIVLRQMLLALRCLARHHMSHGNVKPENILWEHGGEYGYHLCLADFAPLDEPWVSEAVIGEDPFKAPELQKRRQGKTEEADIWSLFAIIVWVKDMDNFRWQCLHIPASKVHNLLVSLSSRESLIRIRSMANRKPSLRPSAKELLKTLTQSPYNITESLEDSLQDMSWPDDISGEDDDEVPRPYYEPYTSSLDDWGETLYSRYSINPGQDEEEDSQMPNTKPTQVPTAK